MKFRTKLYIGLISIAIFSLAIGIGFLFRQYEHFLIRDFNTKVLTAAVTASALVDAEALKQIQKPEDENTPTYRILHNQLLEVTKVNQKSALNITYIYAIMPDPKRPGHLMYSIDADPDPENRFHVGRPYQDPDEKNIIQHLYEPWGSIKFLKDTRGVWFSAYAPILDKNGHYVATLGVDLQAKDIYKEIKTVAYYSLIGLFSALVPAFFVAYLLSHFFSNSLESIAHSLKDIKEGKLDTVTIANTSDEFQDLADEINNMTRGLRERERLKIGFSRYVSQQVLEKILGSEMLPKLEGERKRITVLFSDIRKFTMLAESLPPEQVVSLLNEYFEVMIGVIFANHGMIDKFIGDGLMVEFGALLQDENQEKNAVKAAIEMQLALTNLNEKWCLQGKPVFKIGIGIHTGYAVVGNIGSEKRMEYTTIGDTVNVASRLEQSTKILEVPILISESTYQAAKDQFSFKDLGKIPISGRKETIKVFTVNL